MKMAAGATIAAPTPAKPSTVSTTANNDMNASE